MKSNLENKKKMELDKQEKNRNYELELEIRKKLEKSGIRKKILRIRKIRNEHQELIKLKLELKIRN